MDAGFMRTNSLCLCVESVVLFAAYLHPPMCFWAVTRRSRVIFSGENLIWSCFILAGEFSDTVVGLEEEEEAMGESDRVSWEDALASSSPTDSLPVSLTAASPTEGEDSSAGGHSNGAAQRSLACHRQEDANAHGWLEGHSEGGSNGVSAGQIELNPNHEYEKKNNIEAHKCVYRAQTTRGKDNITANETVWQDVDRAGAIEAMLPDPRTRVSKKGFDLEADRVKIARAIKDKGYAFRKCHCDNRTLWSFRTPTKDWYSSSTLVETRKAFTAKERTVKEKKTPGTAPTSLKQHAQADGGRGGGRDKDRASMKEAAIESQSGLVSPAGQENALVQAPIGPGQHGPGETRGGGGRGKDPALDPAFASPPPRGVGGSASQGVGQICTRQVHPANDQSEDDLRRVFSRWGCWSSHCLLVFFRSEKGNIHAGRQKLIDLVNHHEKWINVLIQEAKDALEIRDELVKHIKIILEHYDFKSFLKYHELAELPNIAFCRTFAAIDMTVRKLLESTDTDTKKSWEESWDLSFKRLTKPTREDISQKSFYDGVAEFFRDVGFEIDTLVPSLSHGIFWSCPAWFVKFMLLIIQHHPAVNKELYERGYRYFSPFNPPQQSCPDDADRHNIDQASLVSNCFLRSSENASLCAYNVEDCPAWTGKDASKEQRYLVADLSRSWHEKEKLRLEDGGMPNLRHI